MFVFIFHIRPVKAVELYSMLDSFQGVIDSNRSYASPEIQKWLLIRSTCSHFLKPLFATGNTVFNFLTFCRIHAQAAADETQTEQSTVQPEPDAEQHSRILIVEGDWTRYGIALNGIVLFFSNTVQSSSGLFQIEFWVISFICIFYCLHFLPIIITFFIRNPKAMQLSTWSCCIFLFVQAAKSCVSV